MNAQTDGSGDLVGRAKARAQCGAHTRAKGVMPVEAALAQRVGMSGLNDKAARPRT